MALLLLCVVVAAWVGIGRISSLGGPSPVPEGYEKLVADGFEIYHPPGLEEPALRAARSGAGFMEQAVAAWGDRLGGLAPPSAPVRLTVFKNHKDFEEFASKELSEDVSRNGGWFDARNLEIALVLTEAQGDVRLGIRHEIAHLLVGRGGGRLDTPMPAWLNEGLATWLETADPQRPDAPARVSDWVRMVAAVREPPTVAEIAGADHETFSSEGNEVYYAYASLLVRFLVDRSPERFWAFAAAARDGRDADLEGLLRVFGPGDQLEAAWTGAMQAARASFVTELGREADRVNRLR